MFGPFKTFPGTRCPSCGSIIVRPGQPATLDCPDCGRLLTNTIPEAMVDPGPDETEKPPKHRKHVQDYDYSDNLDGLAVETLFDQ